tara:strand:+ start:2844 stop:3269 length:426 start_codon:yes stop_codon:yes gene_type:complete
MGRQKTDKSNPVVRYGGVKMIQKRIKRSEIIDHNKDAVAQELIDISTSNITDVLDWRGGKVYLKDPVNIPDAALRSIKKIKVSGKDGENLEIEMHDKIRSLQTVAKAAGLLDQPEQDSDKPSVIGIQIQGPDLIEVKKDES